MTEAIAPPLCPFCGTPWSEAMLAALRDHSAGVFCACCAGEPRPGHVARPLGLPAQDLCCDSCGRPIYRASQPRAAERSRT